MNRYFDFRRFGNYLLYDLKNACRKFGLSTLILGLSPLILFVFGLLCEWVFSGSTCEIPLVLRWMTVMFALALAYIIAPAKLYGPLTDKRYGADYLLLPASQLEKWLSMLIVLCIALPLVMALVTLASDSLLSLCFSGIYSGTLFTAADCSDAIEAFSQFGFSLPLLLFFQWVCNVLIFALGAVWFKRAKIIKTFVAIWLFGMAFSFLFFAAFGSDWIPVERILEDVTVTEDSAISFMRSCVYVFGCAMTVIPAALLYVRVRTIKH